MGKGAGLCENWDTVMWCNEPLDMLEQLTMVNLEQVRNRLFFGRRGWCLFTAYRKIHTRKAELETKKVRMKEEMLGLQSHMAMLQCQN